MNQSVRNPAKLKKIGALILIIDFIVATLFFIFGPSLFVLSPMLSLGVAIVLIGSGIVSFFYFRAVASRDQRV